MSANTFIWCELMTTDVDAAEAFYGKVVGWTPERWSDTPRYTIMKAGESGVSGMMPVPADVAGGGGRPAWFGYVGVPDIEAATRAVAEAGGRVHRPPTDIPQVGRFAVVADPQGAVFMMLQPSGGASTPPVSEETMGRVGWHELHTTDWEAAFGFYAGQFGWTKDLSVDMGPMGTYQLFAAGGAAIGGMMNKMAAVPNPVWGFYFTVPGIDAAAARVVSGGGTVLMGPHEVPGGSWVANCVDPQGAAFSLVSASR